MPLTIAAGTVAGVLLFDGMSWIHAAVIAAILTPTDAALGQAIVTNKKVPIRIRQALNVESGLNDGFMVPPIAILVGIAASSQGGAGYTATFALKQVGFGITVGVAIGATAGWLLERFVSRGHVTGALRQIGVLAIAVAAFAGAEALEGNGFVAAFVAGLAFGVVTTVAADTATDFAEDQGELLVMLTFLFWGTLMVAPSLTELTWQIAAYVLLSLTVVRMLPVAVSLVGLKLEKPTVGILGWFGPRGLASILFSLFAMEHLGGEISDVILVTVTWTVLTSVFIHGITSVPFARMYGEWFGSMTDDQMADMAEAVEVDYMRLRVPMKDNPEA
jgi:NhaP-type Na+/H+ or K+/H+ antiporter